MVCYADTQSSFQLDSSSVMLLHGSFRIKNGPLLNAHGAHAVRNGS